MLIYKGKDAVDLIEKEPYQYLGFQKHALTKYYSLAMCKRCCELGDHSNYLTCDKPVVFYKCGVQHNFERCIASKGHLRCARCIKKFGFSSPKVVHSAMSLTCWTRKDRMSEIWKRDSSSRIQLKI